VTSVSNQGTVSGGNFSNVPTDDPSLPGATDATVTALTVPPFVTASKTDSLVVDADNDGVADPGDTLLYTIVITNSGTGDALAVGLTDTPDANTALVVGSVTTRPEA
jgi:large repetitive protein